MATTDTAACSYCMLTAVMDIGPQAPKVSLCLFDERPATKVGMGLPVACHLSTISLFDAAALAVHEVAGVGPSRWHSELLTTVLSTCVAGMSNFGETMDGSWREELQQQVLQQAVGC